MLHILLDTEAFRAENLDFHSKRLRQIGAYVKTGEVTVYITDVTIEEIKAALTVSVRNALDQLRPKKIRRLLGVLAQSKNANVPGIVGRPDENTILSELNALFEELLTELRAVVISTDDVSVTEVKRRYFANVAPFGDGLKKHEFPDAFSILGAELRARKDGIKLYVISKDNGVADAVKLAPSLDHIATLQDLINRIAGTTRLVAAAKEFVTTFADMIIAEITSQLRESAFFIEGEWGEVTEITIDRVDLQDVDSIETVGNTVTLAFLATVEIGADLWIVEHVGPFGQEDPDSSYNQHVTETWDIEGDLEIRVDLADLDNSELSSLSLYRRSFGFKLAM